MTAPVPSPTSQPPAAKPGGHWCGGPGIVRTWLPGPCPKSIHVPLLGDIPVHELTPDELAKPDGPLDPGNITGTAVAVSPAASGPSGFGSFGLGDIWDLLGKFLTYLTSGTFWKSAGLIIIAVGVGGLGLVLWLGKGQDVEHAAERAATA